MFCYFSTEQQKPQAKKPRRQNQHIQAKERKTNKHHTKSPKKKKNTKKKTRNQTGKKNKSYLTQVPLQMKARAKGRYYIPGKIESNFRLS